VVTGRAFTLDTEDFRLPGPMGMVFFRVHSSAAIRNDNGLGRGWTHSFSWDVRLGRRHTRVWTARGTYVSFDPMEVGGQQQARWGWVLRRHGNGFVLDADDGVMRYFEHAADDGKRYRLTRIVDRNGNTLQLQYTEGLLTQIIDSAGRELRVNNDKDGHITSIQVRNAPARGKWISLVRYAYDNKGCLMSATDADNFSNRYRYDAEFRMLENGYKCGIVFHFVYDAAGRCIESWGAYPDGKDASLAEGLPKFLTDGKTPIKGVHHCRYDYMSDHFTQVDDSTRVTSYQGNDLGLLERSAIGWGVMTAEYRDDGFLMGESSSTSTTRCRGSRGARRSHLVWPSSP